MDSNIISKHDCLVAAGLIALAFLIRIPFLSYPPQAVFDETYFTNFGIRTIKGETDIDVHHIHPPFMRLVFAGIIKSAGFKDLNRKIANGENYGNFPYTPLRLATVIAGSLLAGVIYLLAMKIYGRRLLALLPGIFIVFDGILVTYSRLILYDTYILFFGFSGILALWLAIDSKNRKHELFLFIIAGILMGLAASIKWSGLAFLASGFLLLLQRNRIKYFVFLCLIALLAYSGIFLKLYGTEKIGNILEIQKKMFVAQISITERHPAQSRPWQWPLAYDGPVLWKEGKDIIKLSPNIFSWTAAFVSVVLALYFLIRERSRTLFFLLGSFAANYLPFFLISRPLFLYHYFPALVFAYLLVPSVFKFLSEIVAGSVKTKHFWIVIGIDVLLFIAALPFIY